MWFLQIHKLIGYCQLPIRIFKVDDSQLCVNSSSFFSPCSAGQLYHAPPKTNTGHLLSRQKHQITSNKSIKKNLNPQPMVPQKHTKSLSPWLNMAPPRPPTALGHGVRVATVVVPVACWSRCTCSARRSFSRRPCLPRWPCSGCPWWRSEWRERWCVVGTWGTDSHGWSSRNQGWT